MHMVMSTAENKTSLGPVLTTDVELEGSCVKALIDTGSPVTIVSLKFLLEALKKQRPPQQPLSEWKASVAETNQCVFSKLWRR